jgi:hypothetical protein
MGRTSWIAGVALFGMLAAADVTAQTSDPLTINVVVIDEVGVPAATKRQAQEKASRIFKGLGMTLVWLPAEAPPAGSLIVKIVGAPLGQKGKNPTVLGIAARSKEGRGGIAWLYHRRIAELAQALSLDVSQMMGHVVAHEMGHLLLPHGSHSMAGLMKGEWDTRQAVLASMGALTFDEDQAATIRARLLKPEGTMAHR